ncbi:hypothetical protein Tco_1331467 [Tanacetum coccineum]
MPSKYQQDHKKTLAYAPKIYNDPNMIEQRRDIYRALESRYVHEGRTIDQSFYRDLTNESVAKFANIGFDWLLSLNEQIYPRFIMEFYKTLQLDRNLNKNHFHIQFSDAWGLDELEKNLEQFSPYNSTLPALDDIGNLIHRRTIPEKENVYSAIGNRDHTQEIIALMLNCLENRQPFNLAYFIIRRMYYFRDRRDKVLPYGMILTRLFKILKANMVDHPFDERYILVPRKMSSLKAKQPKKPPTKRTRNVGKSKRAQLTTSSSSNSPPSDNGDLPSTKLSPRSYIRALPNRTNMSQDQRETRGMFKNLDRVLHKFTKMLKKGKGALFVK